MSNIALIILEGKRNDLKISPEEATAIKEEVLQPYREYEHKCHEYEQVLINAASKQYPFSQVIQKDIKDYQQYFGLRNEDIAVIEKRVLTPKQAKCPRIATRVKREIDSGHTSPQNLKPGKPGIIKSSRNAIASVGAIIVLGLLGFLVNIPKESLVSYINSKKILNKSPEIKYSPDDLENILNQVPEIKYAYRLRKINRRVYEQIDLTWKNRQSLNHNLFYRVITAGDGTVLSYLPLDESARKYINQTPIAGVYQLNNQIPIKNEPVAQFRVRFLKGGVLAINPWIGYKYKTPDLFGAEITDANQIKELRQKLYDNIWNNWGGNPTYSQNLRYRVAVRKDGAIADYEPINKAAFDNFRKTPLPKMFAETQSNIPASKNQQPLAHYQVIFSRRSPNGKLKVEPWQGYPRQESDE